METSKTVAIIQARMGSSRLPGKVMMPIVSKPVLWHVVERVKRAKLINQVVVATSTNPEDKKIVDFCEINNIEVFKGSQNDVLDRYFKCAKKYHAKFIVRITADCPLIDPQLIDKLIRKIFKGRYDYIGIAIGGGVVTSKIYRFPQGLDAEIFTFNALREAWKETTDPVDREHVSVYIWRNDKKFKLGQPLSAEKDYSKFRLTLDWLEDLKLIRKIYGKLYKKKRYFNYKDVISLLGKHPSLAAINSQYLGKTHERFYREKLLSEFNKISLSNNLGAKNITAIAILAAKGVKIQGENKERILIAIRLAKEKYKHCPVIFLGTGVQIKFFKKNLQRFGLNQKILFPSYKERTNTKMQIEDLAKLANKQKANNILIVSHAYHIPRIKRYCKRYFDEKNKVYFWPVGSVQKQKRLIEAEIKKIIKYSAKGDIPLFI